MSYGYGNNGGNPYDQRQGGGQQGYGAPSPQYGGYNSGPAMGRDDYEGTNLEMEPLTGTGNSFPRQVDPNAILDECRDITRGISDIQQLMKQIELQQGITLGSTENRHISELDNLNTQLIAMFRNLTIRVKNIKQKPESGSPRNAPQVGKVDRDLKATHKTYRNLEAEYGRKDREQRARQYRIVKPDASDDEVQAALEDPEAQMFAQAIMQSDRRGQANSTLSAVRQRHDAIERLEKQIIEVAQLFEEMDNLVVQQEAAVTNIEMKGEEVVDNMGKGTEQIGVAIQSARNARKWKWWCLGIAVLIIIIIVVVVLIYKFVISAPAKVAKRFVLTDLIPGHAVVPGQGFNPTSKIVVPGLEWKEDKLVVPGADYVPGSRKFKRFEA